MSLAKPLLRLTGLLAFLLLASFAASPARAENSSTIVRESARTLDGGEGRVASFWWLPQEYWELVAKELKLSAEDQEKVRTAFRGYLFVAVLDSKLGEQKPQFATIKEVVEHAKFSRDGEPVEVLREVTPEVVRLSPNLVYLLRTSLGGLGEGLRLLPLSNLDAQGNPVLTGSTPGELRIEYRFDDKSPPQTVFWRAPLTSIAGPKKCPEGGEPLEASFRFCPWHGEKLD
jgi:hypothetical protein